MDGETVYDGYMIDQMVFQFDWSRNQVVNCGIEIKIAVFAQILRWYIKDPGIRGLISMASRKSI